MDRREQTPEIADAVLPGEAAKDEREIRAECCLRHVFCVQGVLGRQNDIPIKRVQVCLRHGAESLFFFGEDEGGSAREAGAACERVELVAGELGTRPDQAHVSTQDVQYLGQFIELPAPKEAPDGRKGLIGDGGHGRARIFAGHDGHRAELEDRKMPSAAPGALLAEEDRAGGGNSYGDAGGDENRERYGKGAQDAETVEGAFAWGAGPAAEMLRMRARGWFYAADGEERGAVRRLGRIDIALLPCHALQTSFSLVLLHLPWMSRVAGAEDIDDAYGWFTGDRKEH